MRTGQLPASDDFVQAVRLHVFSHAAETGEVPQAEVIAQALGEAPDRVRTALKELAAAKVLILAPNDGEIWAANPFCAVPSGFRVDAKDRTYWGICIWDALGVVAAIGAADATVTASCGDCGEIIELVVRDGSIEPTDYRVHFAVPARSWWKNIGFA